MTPEPPQEERKEHVERKQKAERSLQRVTDELEDRVEQLDEDIDEARHRLSSRREEADLAENAAGSWENRARDDEGPFGVLGGPMGQAGATRSDEELEEAARKAEREQAERDASAGAEEERGG